MELDEFAEKQAKQLQQFTDDFLNRIKAVQESFFDELSELVSRLERKDGYIISSVANLRLADKINDVLDRRLSRSGIDDAVNEYIKGFDQQRDLIDQYISDTFGDSSTKFSNALFEKTKRDAINTLSSATPTTRFLEGISSQINTAVETGAAFTDTIKALRLFATGGKVDAGAQLAGRGIQDVDGKLLQYSKQIAYDTIAVSDRSYTNAVAKALNAEWYYYAGDIMITSRKFCIDRVGKYWHRKEIESWADLKWQGKMESTNEQTIFKDLGGHWCQHTLIPVSIDCVPADVIYRNIESGNYEPEKSDIKFVEKREIERFPRDKNLTGEDAKIQERSIRHFVENRIELTDQYIEEFGNTANTDDARKLFKSVGYNGLNASAVHEASSALNKSAISRLVANGDKNSVYMYAGGAGSGKTSAISKLVPNVKDAADVIIDGNLASYYKAAAQIDNYIASGKEINVLYVYRDPVDAWVNGVIKRMLTNKSEGGRIVPMRIFLENTEGSYKTVRQLLPKFSGNKQVKISLIDNSLGLGKTDWMNLEKFQSIEYGDDLRKKLIEETKKLLDAGKITAEQYDKLVNG